MSLPSPLSVGDIILLGQIAYKVAKAFSGAKSAPVEFAEVQSLLFSLKESFDLLARSLTTDRAPNAAASIPQAQNPGEESTPKPHPELANILSNCRDVLRQLEGFVDKYSVLESTTEDQGTSRNRKLRDNLKRSWKKVVWSKEGGEIAKLKQTLIAHTNALHLAVTVINEQVSHSTHFRSKQLTYLWKQRPTGCGKRASRDDAWQARRDIRMVSSEPEVETERRCNYTYDFQSRRRAGRPDAKHST